jgi:adenylate kinase
VHISTGDVLRAEVKAGTDLGHKASDYMNKGALVPDELIIDIVKSRLSGPDCTRKGWLLDGFPRTGVQAEAMRKAGIIADQFILLNVPDETLIQRVLGRRTDPKTGKIYHLKFNPPPDDKAVQKRLVHRADDNLEAIQARIAQYKANVNAVRGYFRGITSELDGVGDKRVIAEKIAQIIKESR